MSYYDLQELACAILGLDYDKLVDNGEEDEIDNALYDKFEISMDQFGDLVKALLPLTMTGARRMTIAIVAVVVLAFTCTAQWMVCKELERHVDTQQQYIEYWHHKCDSMLSKQDSIMDENFNLKREIFKLKYGED